MEAVRSLYGYTMNALKVEQLNERLINLNEIYVMSIINIIFFYNSCFIPKNVG